WILGNIGAAVLADWYQAFFNFSLSFASQAAQQQLWEVFCQPTASGCPPIKTNLRPSAFQSSVFGTLRAPAPSRVALICRYPACRSLIRATGELTTARLASPVDRSRQARGAEIAPLIGSVE